MNLPVMTEDRWARMSWHAQQQWLRAAHTLMRQVRAELDALARDERARVAHTLGVAVYLEQCAADDARHAAERLEQAAEEAGPPPAAVKPERWTLNPDDIAWYLEHEPTATTGQVADRFGVSKAAVQQCVTRASRAGRDELRARLARNAEVARVA